MDYDTMESTFKNFTHLSFRVSISELKITNRMINI